MVTRPNSGRVYVHNYSHKVHMLHNNEHALSRWTLDYNYFARIIAAVGRGQQMCLLTVTQVSSLLVCVWLTAVWVESRADSRDYYSYCPERNSAKSALSLVCCSCTTDWRAFRVSDNTARTHTDILPSPFMALYRTSASALALKFALGFTVPLLACNVEEMDTGGLFLGRFSQAADTPQF